MKTHSRLAAATLAACAVVSVVWPAAAQDPNADGRREVDVLLDRWHDDVGGGRLDRARTLLERRTKVDGNDGSALVELARVQLALDRASEALDTVERALLLFGKDEQAERVRLETQNVKRVENGLEPLEVGSELTERRAQALVLAYLAATENTLARARSLEGEAATAFLREKQPELSRRRQALFALAGEGPGADLVRQETARRTHLRALDRLGVEPRPIGQVDAAGQAVDLRAYRGKVLLVVFWSHALGEGEQALTAVDAAWRELGEKRGFEVLGVCLDPSGGPASQWLADKGIAWRQVFTGEGLTSRDARAWGVTTVPSGALIDHTGRVRWVDPWQGDLRLAIEELLRRKESAEAAAAQRRGW